MEEKKEEKKGKRILPPACLVELIRFGFWVPLPVCGITWSASVVDTVVWSTGPDQ